MRIAIIDESAGRAAIIREGLGEAGLADVVILTDRNALLARLDTLAPEVVLINLENPGRDVHILGRPGWWAYAAADWP